MSSPSMQLMRSASAAVILCALATQAQAQGAANDTALPEISVTAPSPIQSRNAGSGAESAPGLLPVVTDQFATVTVIPNEELRRNGGATLGDVLFSKPGITGSSYAPGAASRPIIRGLDGNRVGIVENGISAGGVSDLGEDHFVPVDPLAADQIEVIRGPAALRYGSTAIGGVVSATNNRIPQSMPTCTAAPFDSYGLPVRAPVSNFGKPSCMSAETRTSISSVDRGIDGAVLLDASGGNVAVHADVYGRRISDYNIPGNPYLDEPGHSTNGRQPNSATRSSGAAIGGSYFFDGGYVGASLTHTKSNYGIPGEHGAELAERISAEQTRLNLKGEYRPDSPIVDAVRFWVSATQYRHHELGLEDHNDPASYGVHQTFASKDIDGRVELQFVPVNLGAAIWTSAFGVQAGYQKLTANSPENIGALYNGLFDPNNTTRIAAYSFNEFAFTPQTKVQVAGRIEHVKLNGATPDFPTSYLPDSSAQFAIGRDITFTPASGSIGLIHQLPGDLVASLTGQFIQRAPKANELFSRGGHHATGTFDIGNPDLALETAKSVELGLRRATGPLRFEATAFYTRFDNFIYRRITDAFCGSDFASCHVHGGGGGGGGGGGHGGHSGHGDHLNQAIYSQRNATFYGAEFQSQFDVGALSGGIWGIENQFDVVRATFTDGTNVPRIPPMRAGGGLFWRDANWLMRLNLLHAFAQNDIAAEGETPTASYNLLKAEISYRTQLDPQRFGARELTVGVIGNNLLNEDIRNAVSYNKNQILMPGMGVRAFANVKF